MIVAKFHQRGEPEADLSNTNKSTQPEPKTREETNTDSFPYRCSQSCEARQNHFKQQEELELHNQFFHEKASK